MDAAKKPKIMVVCNDYRYFLHHRLPVFAVLAARGHEVVIYCGGEFADGHVRDGLTFRHVDCERFRFSPTKDGKLFLQILAALRRERPDVVHTITIKANLFGGLATFVHRKLSRRRLRMVMMNPGLGRFYTAAGGDLRLARRLAGFGFRIALADASSQVVFENFGDRRRWVSDGLVPRARTHVLAGAGVDVEAYSLTGARPAAPPLRILFAARILRTKGIEVFLAAADHLRSKRAAVEFVVAGGIDTNDPDHLPGEALLGRPTVRYVGHRDDIRELLAAAHVVCLPTAYGEGLPRILIEAASMRCALVASDIAGCKAIVRDGKTGRIIPLRDGRIDAAELAGIFEWFLERPARASELGDNARKLIVNGGFDQDIINRRFIAILLGAAEGL